MTIKEYNEMSRTPQSEVTEKRINNSRFIGVKKKFINKNGNMVHLYVSDSGYEADFREFARQRYDIIPKSMGCYEIPEGSERRAEGNFILVEKQIRVSEPNGGFGTMGLDEYKCRIFSACASDENGSGGTDELILDLSGTELRDIVKWSDEKHGDTLCIRITKKSSAYVVYACSNNAVLESSADIVAGKVPLERKIPSTVELKFQNSGSRETQQIENNELEKSIKA